MHGLYAAQSAPAARVATFASVCNTHMQMLQSQIATQAAFGRMEGTNGNSGPVLTFDEEEEAAAQDDEQGGEDEEEFDDDELDEDGEEEEDDDSILDEDDDLEF